MPDVQPSTDVERIEPDETVVTSAPAPLVEDELLVEDVSIDGMCGVY